MRFIPAKCPSCQGDLQIPEKKDFVICMYCGHNIKVREEVLVTDTYKTEVALWFHDARKLSKSYEDNAVEKAIDIYDRILVIQPENAIAWFERGECFKRKLLDQLRGNWYDYFSIFEKFEPEEFTEIYTSFQNAVQFTITEKENIVEKTQVSLAAFAIHYNNYSVSSVLKKFGIEFEIINQPKSDESPYGLMRYAIDVKNLSEHPKLEVAKEIFYKLTLKAIGYVNIAERVIELGGPVTGYLVMDVIDLSRLMLDGFKYTTISKKLFRTDTKIDIIQPDEVHKCFFEVIEKRYSDFIENEKYK
ncbi:MAG: hypothetical protein IAE93_06020 [Ignavibacteria bacterium]|nr:hypothetical protein [Ignavibacteria bacterium]